jgi:serine/threonine protein kinase
MITGNGVLDVGALVGRYRIVSQLARGGMGTVFLARAGESGELVALKAPRDGRPAQVAGLRREAGILCELRHPRVVRVLDCAPEAAMPWMVMPYLRGVTLQAHLRQAQGVVRAVADQQTLPDSSSFEADAVAQVAVSELGPSPITRRTWACDDDRALTLVLELLGALAYLERAQVAHGDVAPSNVLLVDDGPVLIDFGLSERADGPVHAKQGGTCQYLAPERSFGEPARPSGDVYAAGCMLYELIAGRPLFCGSNASLIAQHVGCAPVPLDSLVAGLPDGLEALLGGMLAKQASLRPTAQEAERGLAVLTQGRASGAAPRRGRARLALHPRCAVGSR